MNCFVAEGIEVDPFGNIEGNPKFMEFAFRRKKTGVD